MNHWVMDYETLSNCFLGVFEHYKTDETKVFTVGLLRNDLVDLLEFLDKNAEHNEWHISYNGLAFDAQITEWILVNRKLLLGVDGEEAAQLIYGKAQDVIERMRDREFQEWPEWKLSINQIDLFKLNHWDNAAKSSSLKWIQCSMDWYNVQDMPIEHTAKITTVEQLKEIAKYCRNDVSSTKKIMELSSKQIMLRRTLSKEYDLNLNSASEPKISKEIFLYFLEKQTGIKKSELKELRTKRNVIKVGDLILDYIKFETKTFQDLLENFSNLKLDPFNLKGSFKAHVDYRGVETHFGLGGVHGAKRGIYEPEYNQTIMTSDVTSYYPNLAIRNKWSPKHLPITEFCELYEWFFDERKKIPKSDPRNYVYKIILNSTYGLSNDLNSFLYDPKFTMQITVNGQLSLMMLYEMIAERIPGAIPIMQNTDGVEFMIPTKYKELYLEICEEWEKMTQLNLEHDEYQKMIVPDVNNYIAVMKDKEVNKEEYEQSKKDNPHYVYKELNGKYYVGATKTKGRFEFKDLALHKNKSFLVIRKALFNYFIHGVDPEEYINTNKNILDFCGQVKCKSGWKFKKFYTTPDSEELQEEDLQKTLRYYVSESGGKIRKIKLETGKPTEVEAGKWNQTVFNLHEEKDWNDYQINYQYYMRRIRKEITGMQADIIINKQSTLF